MQDGARRLAASHRAVAWVVAIGAATVVSLWITGFRYGINNNVFHVPYLLRLSTQSEFLHDPFYASLDKFASIVLPILRSLSTEANVATVLQVSHALGRLAAFAMLALLLRTLARGSVLATALALLLLAVTGWFRGVSVVGGHGMFINYFSQTELTWPIFFAALYFVVERRLIAAFLMAGLAFSVNAFVGLWMLWILGVVAVAGGIERPRWAWLALAFAVPAAPVMLWIALLAKPLSGADFSYIEFIRAYFPAHFLIEAADPRALLRLALLTGSGLLASQLLEQRRVWTVLHLAALSIFVIGIPLPYLANVRTVFNLHLLRADGLLQAIACVAIAAAGVRLLCAELPKRRALTGYLMVVSLLALNAGVLLLVCLVSVAQARASAQPAPAVRRFDVAWSKAEPAVLVACGALFVLSVLSAARREHATIVLVFGGVAAAAPLLFFGLRERVSAAAASMAASAAASLFAVALAVQWVDARRSADQSIQAQSADWQALLQWVRSSPLHGPFLVPIGEDGDGFQLGARRVAWVDWKRGAAVMWEPSFYAQWHARYVDVKALHDARAMADYAIAHRIPNLILNDAGEGCPAPFRLLERSGVNRVCAM